MFIQALSNFIQNLQSEVEFDEWYLSDFIDNNVGILSPVEAYEMESHIIQCIKKDINSNELYELLTILLSLQRQSDTTLKPKELENNPNFFEEIIRTNPEDYIRSLVDQLSDSYM